MGAAVVAPPPQAVSRKAANRTHDKDHQNRCMRRENDERGVIITQLLKEYPRTTAPRATAFLVERCSKERYEGRLHDLPLGMRAGDHPACISWVLPGCFPSGDAVRWWSVSWQGVMQGQFNLLAQSMPIEDGPSSWHNHMKRDKAATACHPCA